MARSKQDYQKLIDRFDESNKPEMAKDLIAFAQLPKSIWESLIPLAIRQAETWDSVSKKEAAERLKLDEKLASAALSVAAFFVVDISPGGSDLNALVETLIENKLLSPEQKDFYLSFVDFVRSKEELIVEENERFRLAARLWPSLEKVSIDVDVRLAVSEKSVSRASPVAIVAIKTDTDERRFYMQLSLPQLDLLLNRIEEAKEKIAVATDWIEHRNRS